MKIREHGFLPAALFGAIILAQPCLADDEAPKKAEEEEKEASIHPVKKAAADLREKFQEIRKASQKTEGLFDLYQDQRDGTVFLAIDPDQLDREYIHFSHTVDGIVSANHFRGYFDDAKVITLRKRFDEIDIVAENHSFYFDPKNALSRAADANISPAVIATSKVIGEDRKTGVLLIEADEVFLRELFRQIKPSERKKKEDAEERFTLGDLSKERTRFTELNNYPENTALTVEYVFENLHPTAWPEDADVTDARFVSIEIQHTLIAMPKNNYRPRFDDPRVGFFMTQVTDMTSTSNVPYRDLIHRWHLEPKDDSKTPEPKEPIVWWIENTTPVELRDTIREAVLGWNAAFETAGWKNAMVVKVQPDDAEWDAGDIRYNVLRWSSSPDVPFGGYGPSFVNPRTGQILGADIQLEYRFLTNRVRYQKIFRDPALSPMERLKLSCQLSNRLQQSSHFGRTALKLSGLGKIEVDRLMDEALTMLVLHEVGHTLGLGHNFKASQLHDAETIHQREVTEGPGLTASVMDYSTINVAPVGGKQGQWYDTEPGPYDHWAIEFGYSRAAKGAKAEAARLETILARSTEPGLDYANDADDMRSPGKAIDPRAMIDDMSSDAIGYATQRIEKANDLIDKLVEQSPEEGRSYQTVRDEWSTLMRSIGNQLDVVTRYIGGVYVDRAVAGQKGGTQPLTPVSMADQKRSMNTLAAHAFAPDAFGASPELLAHLQRQRRGWDFESDGEDPKILERILAIQDSVLDHLLHRNTVTRILNSDLYGNDYQLAGVVGDLTTAIFEADGELELRPEAVRQGLQRSYVDRLIDIAGLDRESNYPQPAQAIAFVQLADLQEKLAIRIHPHHRHLHWVITQALESKE